jgi:hypothetical protein
VTGVHLKGAERAFAIAHCALLVRDAPPLCAVHFESTGWVLTKLGVTSPPRQGHKWPVSWLQEGGGGGEGEVRSAEELVDVQAWGPRDDGTAAGKGRASKDGSAHGCEEGEDNVRPEGGLV